VPFAVFILPGFLYYSLTTRNNDLNDWHRKPALAFAWCGFLQIIILTTCTLFNLQGVFWEEDEDLKPDPADF